MYCRENEECLISSAVNLVHKLSSKRFMAQVQCWLTAFDLAESAAVNFIAKGFYIISNDKGKMTRTPCLLCNLHLRFLSMLVFSFKSFSIAFTQIW